MIDSVSICYPFSKLILYKSLLQAGGQILESNKRDYLFFIRRLLFFSLFLACYYLLLQNWKEIIKRERKRVPGETETLKQSLCCRKKIQYARNLIVGKNTEIKITRQKERIRMYRDKLPVFGFSAWFLARCYSGSWFCWRIERSISSQQSSQFTGKFPILRICHMPNCH